LRATASEQSVPRATRVLPAHGFDPARVVDSVVLGHERRRARAGEWVGVKGIRFALDLDAETDLRAGDALELENGDLIEVVAAAEPLLEVRAADSPALARIAWHLGDRHVPIQMFANRIRLRREPALEALIASLGGKIVAIEAPFDPEGGAYARHAQAHHQNHDQGHEAHAHEHHHPHEP